MRIAYQDEGAGWGEAAARRVDERAALMPCRTVDEVFVAVGAGLATHGVLPIETSTTGSLRRNYDALLAHELSIVAEVELTVGDGERTRFLAVGEALPHAVADKTTIVFSLPDEPGALWRALSVFALRLIDLTRLESRPIPGRPWEYLFYADLAAATERGALRARARAARRVRPNPPHARVVPELEAARAADARSLRDARVSGGVNPLTSGPSRAPARAMLRAAGVSELELSQPLIGIANTWTEIGPCNLHLRELAAHVKDGVRAQGGTPLEFNTVSISDGITMGTEGMRASLVSREVIADSIELVVRGNALDGVVALVGCDKTIPGAVMALARLNVPGLVLYGGSIAPGRWNGREVTIQDVFEAVGAHAAGRLDDAGLRSLEAVACPGAGACGGQFTANTMAIACEFLGIAALGSGTVPATDPAKREAARTAGEQVMALVRAGTRPRDLLTRAAIEQRDGVGRRDRRLHQRRAAPARDRARGGRRFRARGVQRRQRPRAAHRRPEAGRPVRRDRSARGRRRPSAGAAARRRRGSSTAPRRRSRDDRSARKPRSPSRRRDRT